MKNLLLFLFIALSSGAWAQTTTSGGNRSTQVTYPTTAIPYGNNTTTPVFDATKLSFTASTGLLTSTLGKFGQVNIGNWNSWPTNTDAYIAFSSTTGGLPYPFNVNGNLVLNPRLGNFDIVFGGGMAAHSVRANLKGATGNFQVGVTDLSDLGAKLSIAQPSTGDGTITTTAGGTTVTGVNTQFTNTFRVGDNITANGETRAITAIASNTSITTAAWTNANSNIAYTLGGGTQFQVAGNGIVTINRLPVLSTNGTDPLLVRDGGTGNIKYVNPPMYGRFTASGTGVATSIVIPHSFTGISAASIAFVTAKNAASIGPFSVTTDATNITITYTTPPASGTGNLTYDVQIKP